MKAVSLTGSMIIGIVALLSATTVNAWTGKSIQNRRLALSSSSLQSQRNADFGAASPAPSLNRRLLLVGTGIAASTAIVSPASAATASGPYSPAPNSMDGKLVVITGGNTGLGLESGKRLAAAGAEVVLTSRSSAKGKQAVKAIQEYLSQKGIVNNNIYSIPLDLCDLENVKSFPQRFEAALPNSKPVDVLLNNAGVMAIQQREITKDGYERTFQTNHLGHFALTAKMIPMLAKDARIINVSSTAHKFASNGLDFDNLNGEKEYGPWTSYGASKLENIFFTKELQRRVDESGKYSFTVTSLHPGAVATDLGRYLVGEEKFNSMKENGMGFMDSLIFGTLNKFVKTVEDGASTQVFLASDPLAGMEVGGQYFDECKQQKLDSFATNAEQAKQLWTVSEKLSGVDFIL
mmetsp:Transcript_3367/g.4871  ORF Transcript_3367/g.4871 Transcript_3367/m.4871 type:complete len:406 (+) Transcript_3367:84-1301(+)